ncbi:chemotaxis-specific protein-glutamate methyltransferase CheB [Ancylobacter sonchi]|uniref:chemotaxis-specific protein-glutamate methyltransferase CheB n=1 Tax=Ancylobacter sonchi TaxID=1937790 RepID=UPI001BD23F86|nr:chemotaxis-specific protein-glutamate methyltransferase CheB [Ancylobacter sonchi]MBS7533140.1 chemotaxis-specific protein-glutamate methyltransferase CheB [Ancylobacter sonchi]
MRIGIVNDLPLAAEVLRRAVAGTHEHEVAWIASNGREAVEACRRDLPDLLLMDLVMPEMDGVEATRRIMRDTPCPILLVIASVDGNIPGVYEAMGHGALDAVDIPSVNLAEGMSIQADVLLTKITTIGKLIGDGRSPRQAPPAVAAAGPVPPLVVIGASAGGPAAVATLLAGLPADFPAALILVQHVDEKFVPGLASWLGQHTALKVRPALEGDRPEVGTVLIAASADHLILTATGVMAYTPDPRAYPYRPSVDVFFKSVARLWRGDTVAVLLTGMGRDGALGLKMLRDAHHLTIAQDKDSSAVYGMPKAAAAIGAAAEILPLDLIARRLTAVFGRSQ